MSRLERRYPASRAFICDLCHIFPLQWRTKGNCGSDMFGDHINALGNRCSEAIEKIREHRAEPPDRHRSKFSASRTEPMSGVALAVGDSLGMAPTRFRLPIDVGLQIGPKDGLRSRPALPAKGHDRLTKGDGRARAVNPEVVITQFGIVNWSPRYSNRIERAAFEFLSPVLTEPYMTLMRRFRRRHPKPAHVSPSPFGTTWLISIAEQHSTGPASCRLR
jgi:hypothetical protein